MYIHLVKRLLQLTDVTCQTTSLAWALQISWKTHCSTSSIRLHQKLHIKKFSHCCLLACRAQQKKSGLYIFLRALMGTSLRLLRGANNANFFISLSRKIRQLRTTFILSICTGLSATRSAHLKKVGGKCRGNKGSILQCLCHGGGAAKMTVDWFYVDLKVL